MQNLTLSDGHDIPPLALGLWQVTEEAQFNDMFDAAVTAGYRHFDSAQIYNNEQLLGAAIKRHGLRREDLFITTKINPSNFGHGRTARSISESLQKLQMDYVDLLLLHFPVPVLKRGSWRALRQAQAAGQTKSIGVSNFMIRHLKSLPTPPAVNQIELHVFLQQPKLLKYCHDNNILVEAYSPLAHAQANDNSVIQAIADKHNKSYAQVMLRWCLQQEAVILPKSKTPSRLAENIDVFDFELDAEDMAQLKLQNRNLHTCAPTRSAYYMP